MIRPALFSDCASIFQLLCSAQGVQGTYASFAEAYADSLDDSRSCCLVSEEAGRVTGFVVLRSAESVEDMTVERAVVASDHSGMQMFLIVQACRIAYAMGHDTLAASFETVPAPIATAA